MAIPFDPFANTDKQPVSPAVPGTLPGTPIDLDMDSDITKEDKDAFREIEKRKNPASARQDKRPSTVFTEPKDGSGKNAYLETIFKQNLYYEGDKQGKSNDVHKSPKEYETTNPIHGANEKNTDINKELKDRTSETYEKRKRDEEELMMSFDKFKTEAHGFDVGLREQNFQNHQSEYDTNLQNLNVNKKRGSKTVLNDSKTRAEITSLVDDSINRYEDKYDHNETNLSKITLNKRLPVYNSTHEQRVDGYNALSVLDSTDGTEKNLNRLPKKYANLDFVPLYFHDLVNRKFIPFRCYLKSLDDQHDANWVETQYLGRADVVGVYQGFTRAVNFSFECAAFSIDELHPMWQRINYLVGLTRPAGYTNESESGPIKESYSSFIIPPIVEFNLGDIYLEQPVLIKSIGVTIPESNWELQNNEDDRLDEYAYLNGHVQRTAKTARYPMSCEITVSMTMLEKNAPKTKQRHFGHAKEDGTAVYVNINRSSYDKNGPFNEQLIHYKDDEDYDTQQYQPPSSSTDVNFREALELEREEEAQRNQNNKNNQNVISPDKDSDTRNIAVDPTPTPTNDENDLDENWVALELCLGSGGAGKQPSIGIMKIDVPLTLPSNSVISINEFLDESGGSLGPMEGCYTFLSQLTTSEKVSSDLTLLCDYLGVDQENSLVRKGEGSVVSASIVTYGDCDDCFIQNPDIIIPYPVVRPPG